MMAKQTKKHKEEVQEEDQDGHTAVLGGGPKISS
jgi:hypothetical protein